MTHKIQAWLYHNTENLTGFVTGSIVTTSILGTAISIIQTLILALLSGALGSLGAYYMKKILTKNKDENTQNK